MIGCVVCVGYLGVVGCEVLYCVVVCDVVGVVFDLCGVCV